MSKGSGSTKSSTSSSPSGISQSQNTMKVGATYKSNDALKYDIVSDAISMMSESSKRLKPSFDNLDVSVSSSKGMVNYTVIDPDPNIVKYYIYSFEQDEETKKLKFKKREIQSI